eukprot:gene5776-1029_t
MDPVRNHTHHSVYAAIGPSTDAMGWEAIVRAHTPSHSGQDLPEWCFPYPRCARGAAHVSAMIAEDIGGDAVWTVLSSPGRLVTMNETGSVYFESWSLSLEGCLVGSPRALVWTLDSDNTTVAEWHWHFDQPRWQDQLDACKAGPGSVPTPPPASPAPVVAIVNRLLKSGSSRAASENFLSASALIRPGGHWCDPVPVCETGPSAARAYLAAEAQGVGWQSLSLLSSVSSAGNGTVGSFRTQWTGTVPEDLSPPRGCILSGPVFYVFQMSHRDPHASSLDWLHAYYSWDDFPVPTC